MYNSTVSEVYADKSVHSVGKFLSFFSLWSGIQFFIICVSWYFVCNASFCSAIISLQFSSSTSPSECQSNFFSL